MSEIAAPVYLSTEGVARRYNVNEDTARRWIRTGRIPGVRLGGAYRVRLDDLERLEANGEMPTEGPERSESLALLARLEEIAGVNPDLQEIYEITAELRRVVNDQDETALMRRVGALREAFPNQSTVLERLEWMRLGAAMAIRVDNAEESTDVECECGETGTMDDIIDHVEDNLNDLDFGPVEHQVNVLAVA